ncbi:alpha/beta hydrolase [Bacillus salitolerans]|uniref:Alpha/beta hydrolase n=1 Tax=Bacillus salitolerans TaxID=1437434 RepID=A0ABW4LZY5_9BACI
MKKRMLWIIGSILLITAVILIGAGNYFYSVAINRHHEPISLHGGSEPASGEEAREEQAKLEELVKWTEGKQFDSAEVISEDGLKLSAIFLKNEHSNGKAVILAHGYKGNNTQMPGITKYYYELGYNILKPDARGHGKSEGDYIGYGWHDRKDYQIWIDYLIDKKKAKNIFLHGFSMGAATVLMTSGEELPIEVKGIISDSGYTSVHEELSHQLKYLYRLPAFPIMQVTSIVTTLRAGYSFTEASAIEQVKKNSLPLFIIHGDKDELVPTEMANELYEAAGENKEIWIVPGAGHTEGYTVAEAEYQARLKDFLRNAIQ